MKFCLKCKGSGKVLVKATLSTYPGSFDYYPQDCQQCSGTGYIVNKSLTIKN